MFPREYGCPLSQKLSYHFTSVAILSGADSHALMITEVGSTGPVPVYGGPPWSGYWTGRTPSLNLLVKKSSQVLNPYRGTLASHTYSWSKVRSVRPSLPFAASFSSPSSDSQPSRHGADASEAKKLPQYVRTFSKAALTLGSRKNKLPDGVPMGQSRMALIGKPMRPDAVSGSFLSYHSGPCSMMTFITSKSSSKFPMVLFPTGSLL
ncbi:hypothetical protein ABW19_dt0203767 [Dactylella cylindrospora]|nr:hypothetical protein ABW19_dt0203767 [Dactylella cylindrospora]